jgi:hypothetical protein
MAHIHLSRTGLLYVSPYDRQYSLRTLCVVHCCHSHKAHPPRAPLLCRHYIRFIATTSPCASPVGSLSCFGFILMRSALAACCHPRLPISTFSTLCCFSFPKCHAPYVGGSSSARNQFFPDDFGLHLHVQARLPASFSQTASCEGRFRHGRHFFMLWPSGLLASLTVRHHYVQHPKASTSELAANLLPPWQSDMLPG